MTFISYENIFPLRGKKIHGVQNGLTTSLSPILALGQSWSLPPLPVSLAPFSSHPYLHPAKAAASQECVWTIQKTSLPLFTPPSNAHKHLHCTPCGPEYVDTSYVLTPSGFWSQAIGERSSQILETTRESLTQGLLESELWDHVLKRGPKTPSGYVLLVP